VVKNRAPGLAKEGGSIGSVEDNRRTGRRERTKKEEVRGATSLGILSLTLGGEPKGKRTRSTGGLHHSSKKEIWGTPSPLSKIEIY